MLEVAAKRIVSIAVGGIVVAGFLPLPASAVVESERLGAQAPATVGAAEDARWRPLRQDDRPPIWAFELAYDRGNDRVVAVLPGADHQRVDTWVREGHTWREIETAHSPSHREGFALAYDAARQEVVLFGGDLCKGCRRFADTWVFDGVDWEQRDPDTSPHEGSGVMVFDPARDELVLFMDNHVEYGTLTWTWDGSTWTEHATAKRPADDLHHYAMAWDRARQAVVLHGGSTFDQGESVFSPWTWAWDGTSWAKIAKGPEVALHGMATYGQQGRALRRPPRRGRVQGDLGARVGRLDPARPPARADPVDAQHTHPARASTSAAHPEHHQLRPLPLAIP